MNYLNMYESTTQIYAVERNWAQKDTFSMILFIWNSTKYKFSMWCKEKISGCPCRWEDFLGRSIMNLWGDRNVPYIDDEDGYPSISVC